MPRESPAQPCQPDPAGQAFLRFNSVTDLVQTVKGRSPGADVWTETRDHDFLLCVRGRDVEYDSLIVHFEGEGCYAVEVY